MLMWRNPAVTPVPEDAMRSIYLHPGQILASSQPCSVTTILGSCVAVCLWDGEMQVGGINHFLLPHRAGGGSASPRFGNVAMEQLFRGLLAEGARREGLRAKVFGGACVLEALRGLGRSLGPKNVEVARRFLNEQGIPVVAEDTEGDRGRKLTFRTNDGSATVRMLAGGGHGND